MRRLLVLAALCCALPAHAVTIDWASVGDPGNACEQQLAGCFGSLDYVYRIGKYEVTNAQYAEFLKAVAARDTHALYNPHMADPPLGGIVQSRISGKQQGLGCATVPLLDRSPFSYSVNPGMGNKPVNFVSFYDALRFANWLHNGQPTGAQDNTTTEDGAYTITAKGIAANSITRNPGAMIFLPNEDEWYKAAYFNGTRYFYNPTGSDEPTTCAPPGATPNTANCGWWAGQTLAEVGSYTGSASPYGTFDQGGNVWEWNETIRATDRRGMRGGSIIIEPGRLRAVVRGLIPSPASEHPVLGFRVASRSKPPPPPSSPSD